MHSLSAEARHLTTGENEIFKPLSLHHQLPMGAFVGFLFFITCHIPLWMPLLSLFALEKDLVSPSSAISVIGVPPLLGLLIPVSQSVSWSGPFAYKVWRLASLIFICILIIRPHIRSMAVVEALQTRQGPNGMMMMRRSNPGRSSVIER